MKALFIVNHAAAVMPTQTTALLMRALAARGHRVAVCGVGDLSVRGADDVVARTADGPVDVLGHDLIMLRTNLARDLARRAQHAVALAAARMARDAGVTVINDPDGMIRASNKLYVTAVPAQFRPRTLVTSDRKALLAFVAESPGPTILKPLDGTHGRDVFLVHPDSPSNTPQIVEVLLRAGYAVAQEFVQSDVPGDTRVLVIDGEVLRVEGVDAVVRRVPGAGDFRSNVHAGGSPVPGVLTPGMAAAVESLGPRLRNDDVFFAGLDFVGDKIVEVNVSAVGGLEDAERFGGAPFTAALVAAIEDRVARGRADGDRGAPR